MATMTVAPKKWFRMEAEISILLDGFFSPSNLLVDIYLQQRMHEWIPVSVFEGPQRLGSLAYDEAVVAKAVRARSERCEMSDDGTRIRLRKNLRSDTLQTLNSSANVCFYLEHIPHNSTIASLLAHAASRAIHINRIRIPLSSILHSLHKSCIVPATTFDALYLNLIDLDTTAALPEAFASFQLADFVFVDVNLHGLGDSIQSRLGQRYTSLKLGDGERAMDYLMHELFFATKEEISTEWDYVRVLPMQEWTKRMKEYQTLLDERKRVLDALMRSKSGSHTNGAVFENGVVVHYTGVHIGTNRKVLKRLFELISPVSYIDHSKGETEGYIRFKTQHGAALAAQYLHRHTLLQTHAGDTGTLITSRTQLARIKSREVFVAAQEWWDDETTEEEDMGDVVGVRVRVLQGAEQRAYWNNIYEKRCEPQTVGGSGPSWASKPVVSHALSLQRDKLVKANTISAKVETRRVHVTFGENDSRPVRTDEPICGDSLRLDKEEGANG
ncbi:hypothetical protein BC830DRAFT_1107754, partial [Chytriomyces sp. MP71]